MSTSDKVSYASSVAHVILIRAALIVLGIGCWVAGVLLGRSGEPWNAFTVFVMGAGAFGLFFATVGRFGVVTLTEQGVVVHQGGQDFDVAWSDIASFWVVPFVAPPIYRFRYRSRNQATYFVPSSYAVINLGFWSFDLSGMGKFIRRKLRDHGVI